MIIEQAEHFVGGRKQMQHKLISKVATKVHSSVRYLVEESDVVFAPRVQIKVTSKSRNAVCTKSQETPLPYENSDSLIERPNKSVLPFQYKL